jgi:phosphonate degradation associated HDIG domain protein
MTPLEKIFALFAERGRDLYSGECVSQLAHALQAAHLAESAGASDSLVVACLMHDVGHLLRATEDFTRDDRHDAIGAAWLATSFPASVAVPVRLHVAAKRYLSSVEPEYRQGLSHASECSLQVQGGPFGEQGVAAFEREPFFADAVKLRRWDDLAKIDGLMVPALDHYAETVHRVYFARDRSKRAT